MGKSIWDTRFGKRGIAQDEYVQVEEGDSWKTIHGAHVLLGDDGRIKAGAGGKFTGMRLEGFGRPDEARQSEHDDALKNMRNSAYSNAMSEIDRNPETRTKILSIKREAAVKEYSKEFANKAQNYIKQFEVSNPPKPLAEPMSEEDAIARIAGGDQTGGSCASAVMAFVANQELGLDVRDFRGGASQLAVAYGDQQALIEATEGDYDPKAEGGKVFFTNPKDADAAVSEALKALDSMKPGKNYVAALGGHTAMVRKTADGDIQYLELQGTGHDSLDQYNQWHTLVGSKASYRKDWNPNDPYNAQFGTSEKLRQRMASHELQKRFGMGTYPYPRAHGVVPADRYAQTDYMKNMLQYVNTSEGKQMKGSGGGIK